MELTLKFRKLIPTTTTTSKHSFLNQQYQQHQQNISQEQQNIREWLFMTLRKVELEVYRFHELVFFFKTEASQKLHNRTDPFHVVAIQEEETSSTSVEVLMKMFDDLSKTIKVLEEETSKNEQYRACLVSNQEKQHLERIIQNLQHRLSSSGSEFKQILENRAKIEAIKKERQENLFGGGKSKKMYSYELPPNNNNSLENNWNGNVRKRTFHSNNNNNNNNVPHQQPLFVTEYNNDKAYQQEVVDKKTVTNNNSKQFEKIEKNISELGQLFLQVAGVVQSHGEIIHDIESNLDDTIAHTNEAQNELVKLFNFISGDRWLIIKMFIAITIIGMIIIYFWT